MGFFLCLRFIVYCLRRGRFRFLGGWFGLKVSLLRFLFFVWMATRNRILTIDNMIRRRQVLVNWCCLCRADAESVDHILVHCMVASELWSLVLAIIWDLNFYYLLYSNYNLEVFNVRYGKAILILIII